MRGHVTECMVSMRISGRVHACMFNVSGCGMLVFGELFPFNVLIFDPLDSDRLNQSCQCENGYKKEGRNCVAIYGEALVTGDDFLNISAIKKGHNMIFFQVCQTCVFYITRPAFNPMLGYV